MYTQLGVLSKGTVIECNVRYPFPHPPSSIPIIITHKPHLTLIQISELGMVTAGGKVIWGRYAQITVRFTPSPQTQSQINVQALTSPPHQE